MTARSLRPDKTIGWVTKANDAFDLDAAKACVEAVGEPLVGPYVITPDIRDAFDNDGDRRLASLAYELNNAAATYRWDTHMASLASSAQVVKQCQAIRAAGEKFLKAFGLSEVDDPDHLYPRLGAGGLWGMAALEARMEDPVAEGKPRVSAALRGVVSLIRWAKQVEAREAPKVVKRDRSERHAADESYHQLLRQLGGAFYQYWGKQPKPGSTTSSGRPDSPFLRFLLYTLPPIMGRARSVESINTAWRRCQINFGSI